MTQASPVSFDQALKELAAIETVVLSNGFVDPTAEKVGVSREHLFYYLNLSVGEARHALRILFETDIVGKTILEIGCGAGLMAAALRKLGMKITTLEPGGVGIEYNKSLAHCVFERFEVSGDHLDIAAEELDPEQHGTFDLVFSHNVFEHVGNLDSCFAALFRVLASGGGIVGHCPNYFVPYEPHYGSWLIPGFPRWSKPFLSYKRLKDDGTWRSLNFITYRDVRKIAKRHGLGLEFKAGVIAEAFERMDTVPAFGERHRFFKIIYDFIKIFHLLSVLKKWPGEFGSPMTFELRRPGI